MADRTLTAGSILAVEDVRLIPVDSSFEGVSALLTESQVSGFEGWVVDRSFADGELLTRSALVEPGGPSGLRSMSIPISVEHAAGGSITEGDRVDVITVFDGQGRFVTSALEVIGVSDVAAGGIGASGGYHIVVAVTADDALRLAEAIAGGSLEVVRSTGAPGLEGDDVGP